MRIHYQEVLFVSSGKFARAENALGTSVLIPAHHNGRAVPLEMGSDLGEMLAQIIAAANVENFARNVIDRINNQTHPEN